MKRVREGYKVTELGEIPQDWNVNKLEDVCEQIFVGIATSTAEYYTENGIPIIRNQNIKKDYIDTNEILMITKEFSEMNENKKLKEGDILTVRTGYPGTSCVVPKEFENTHTFTTLISRPNKKKVDSDYLCRYINSEKGMKFINSGKAGGAQQNLNVATLIKMPVIVPNLLEQQKISLVLTSVDEQIKITDNLIEKTKKLKKWLMQKLLTKGIGHSRFKDTEVGSIPEEWEVVRINDVADVISGGTPSTKKDEYWYNGTINWATPTDITANGKYIGKTVNSITESGLKNSSANLLPIGTVLMTSRATIGEKCINTVPMCTNQGFKSFICKDNLYNEFMYYLIEIIRDGLISLAGGSTFLEISKSSVEGYKISIPLLEEQHKIASILSAIDEQIEQYESKKEKLQELKKGLMQKLLTGSIRVKV